MHSAMGTIGCMVQEKGTPFPSSRHHQSYDTVGWVI